MSYHNLHLLHYRRQRQSSFISAENLESNSDNTNKQVYLPSTSTTPTAIFIKIQNKNQSKICLLKTRQQPKQFVEKPKANILVDYCTYHDVSVSRVTCL